MVLSTHVYVEHPDLALAHTIGSLPDVALGVVSDAGTDPDHDVYLFWIDAPDFDALEAALAADHTVADFAVVVEADGQRTYRIEYSDEAKVLTPAIAEIGGLTLSSESHADGWLLHLQLRDHEALYALDEFASKEGIRLEVRELQQDGEFDLDEGFGLTEAQAEALVAAYVHGYFDEPREIDLEGLAALLGISRTAVSGRLRRGAATLVEEIIAEDERLTGS